MFSWIGEAFGLRNFLVCLFTTIIMFCFRLFFALSSSSSCFVAEQWIVGAGRDGEEQEVKQFVTSIQTPYLQKKNTVFFSNSDLLPVLATTVFLQCHQEGHH